MTSPSPRLPMWRIFGASLGVFAIALHVLLSAWMVHAADAAGLFDPSVICTHDGAATGFGASQSDASKDGPAGAVGHACLACACLHHGGLSGPLPAVTLDLLVVPADPLIITAPQTRGTARSLAPYAARPPPHLA